MNKTSKKTQQLVGTAVLVAIIILLQTLLGSISIGPFTITLTIIPIIIGAVLYGPATGALLGAIFGVVVCVQVVTGAAGAGSTMMLELNAPATIIVCIVKGLAAGLIAGLACNLFREKNLYIGIIVAAILAPVANTGIFTIALVTVFRSLAEQWALGAGAASVGAYILTGIIGINFVIELTADLVLSPIIYRIIKAVKAA